MSSNDNQWVIVAIDYMTGYAETKPLPHATEKEVADFFRNSLLLSHGAPKSITSYRGTPAPFIGKHLHKVLQIASTIHDVKSAYDPQANDLTEQLNRTLGNVMSMYI